MQERDGAIRIAWSSDRHESIRVVAPHRSVGELVAFASDVADVALLNREPATLQAALRERLGAAFDLESREGGAEPGVEEVADYLVVTLHPPQGMPNPDG